MSQAVLSPVLDQFNDQWLSETVTATAKQAFAELLMQKMVQDGHFTSETAVAPDLQVTLKNAVAAAIATTLDEELPMEDRINLLLGFGLAWLCHNGVPDQALSMIMTEFEHLLEHAEAQGAAQSLLSEAKKTVEAFQIIATDSGFQSKEDAYVAAQRAVAEVKSTKTNTFRTKNLLSSLFIFASGMAVKMVGQEKIAVACLSKAFKAMTIESGPFAFMRPAACLNMVSTCNPDLLRATFTPLAKSIFALLQRLECGREDTSQAQMDYWLDILTDMMQLYSIHDAPAGQAEDLMKRTIALMDPERAVFGLETLMCACLRFESNNLLRDLIRSIGQSDSWRQMVLDIRWTYLFDHAHAGTQPVFVVLRDKYLDLVAQYRRENPRLLKKAKLPCLTSRLLENGYDVTGPQLMQKWSQLDKNVVRIGNNFEMMRRILKSL
eukprot:TRINITY_DN1161_c0_g1_i1.p1 TRINITY_DN1161_c0_g1~~TRINITY_DN1161_c0_g1_i1.p1  ORF type:complete len:444 (+),score=101.62 TRINITY_DN1161_c0_g1_i1:25-1332(+)